MEITYVKSEDDRLLSLFYYNHKLLSTTEKIKLGYLLFDSFSRSNVSQEMPQGILNIPFPENIPCCMMRFNRLQLYFLYLTWHSVTSERKEHFIRCVWFPVMSKDPKSITIFFRNLRGILEGWHLQEYLNENSWNHLRSAGFFEWSEIERIFDLRDAEYNNVLHIFVHTSLFRRIDFRNDRIHNLLYEPNHALVQAIDFFPINHLYRDFYCFYPRLFFQKKIVNYLNKYLINDVITIIREFVCLRKI